MTMEVVTLNYRAPELLLGYKNYNNSVDIWSLGCIFLELLTGKQLFHEKNEFGLLISIFKTLGKPTENEWPQISSFPYLNIDLECEKTGLIDKYASVPSLSDLLFRMLEINPNKRISAKQALNHRFFYTMIN